MRLLPALFQATAYCLIWGSSQVVGEEPPPPGAVEKNPKVEDVFTLVDAPGKGNCNEHMKNLNGFLVESVDLLNAATKAIASHKTDKAYRELFAAWLGIDCDETVSSAELEDESISLWSTINDRFASVSQFLSQGGIKNSRTGKKPFLFCGDDFADYKDWGSIAKDAEGKDAVKTVDEDGDPDDWYTVQSLYGSLNNGRRNPFWAEQLKGYDFDDYHRVTKLCSRPSRYAGTLPPSQGIQHSDNTGDFDAHVFLCPTTFDPGSFKMTGHSIPVLKAVLQNTVYPNADRRYGLD